MLHTKVQSMASFISKYCVSLLGSSSFKKYISVAHQQLICMQHWTSDHY